MRTSRPGVLALVVLTFGSGYFLSYFFRNVNAVLSPIIVEEFALSATQIGLLTSAYFVMAALVLIPIGILLDHYGPRRVLVCQLVVTALGAIVFAAGQSVETLLVGRALIGLGVAGCLTTAFKAVTVWFPRNKWATGNSLVLGVGSLGVISGTQPLQILLEFVTWREVFWIGAAASLVMGVVALTLLTDRKPEKGPGGVGSVYGQVLRLSVFWHLVPVVSLSLAVFFAIQGLWANTWMADVAGLSQADIGQRLLVMALAMTCGMLFNGTIADKLAGFGVPLAAVMTSGFAGLLVSQATLVFELAPQAWWPWALMGFTGNIGALGYPLISRRFSSQESARVMSTVAVTGFGLAFVVQFAFGWSLDLWGRDAAGAYPAQAYATTMGVLVALQLLTFVWFIVSRDVWDHSDQERAAA